jgi:bifunctional NMN adenylyltransferase/nudix hydrolase
MLLPQGVTMMTRGLLLAARFQPLTRAQEAWLAQALASASRVAIGLIGADEARSARYPLTAEERMEMISRALPVSENARISFVPLRAYAEPGEHQASLTHAFGSGLEWSFQEGPSGDETEIWQAFYEGKPDFREQVSPAVWRFLDGWRDTPPFADMQEEHRAIQVGRKRWGTGPFVTLDALVVAQGHVLLVRRGRCPGKGLFALPGGFLEPDEFLLEGALRELREETGLHLRNQAHALKGVRVFDHPGRSQRGRTITHVHHFELRSPTLPEVQGADDAAEAQWIPLPDISKMERVFFEDHHHILTRFFPVLCDGPA